MSTREASNTRPDLSSTKPKTIKEYLGKFVLNRRPEQPPEFPLTDEYEPTFYDWMNRTFESITLTMSEKNTGHGLSAKQLVDEYVRNIIFFETPDREPKIHEALLQLHNLIHEAMYILYSYEQDEGILGEQLQSLIDCEKTVQKAIVITCELINSEDPRDRAFSDKCTLLNTTLNALGENIITKKESISISINELQKEHPKLLRTIIELLKILSIIAEYDKMIRNTETNIISFETTKELASQQLRAKQARDQVATAYLQSSNLSVDSFAIDASVIKKAITRGLMVSEINEPNDDTVAVREDTQSGLNDKNVSELIAEVSESLRPLLQLQPPVRNADSLAGIEGSLATILREYEIEVGELARLISVIKHTLDLIIGYYDADNSEASNGLHVKTVSCHKSIEYIAQDNIQNNAGTIDSIKEELKRLIRELKHIADKKKTSEQNRIRENLAVSAGVIDQQYRSNEVFKTLIEQIEKDLSNQSTGVN
jgi:hypothetical protein